MASNVETSDHMQSVCVNGIHMVLTLNRPASDQLAKSSDNRILK